MRKKFGYILGAVSFWWLLTVGGSDIPEPFFKNALIILVAVALGIGGLLLSVRLAR
jgi:hypothetical protein